MGDLDAGLIRLEVKLEANIPSKNELVITEIAKPYDINVNNILTDITFHHHHMSLSLYTTPCSSIQ